MLIDREELWNDIARKCKVTENIKEDGMSGVIHFAGLSAAIDAIVAAPEIKAIPVDWILNRYLARIHDMLDEARADGNDEYTERLYRRYEAIRYLVEDWKKENE